MQSITKILLYYFSEKVGRLSFQADEEAKAYELLEKEFSASQKELFLNWENLKMEQHCEEIEFWFDYAFKVAFHFLFEILSNPLK